MIVQTQPAAQITLLSGPDTIPESRAALYRLTVANCSDEAWTSNELNPVHISYHWYDERGQLVHYDGLRTALPRTIAPGDRAEVTLRVHPPPDPGRYLLEIDMMREGVTWFDAGLRITVEVQPTTRPRAVLVNSNCLANDAVGINVLRKLCLLRAWGYAPVLLTEYIDGRVPPEDQAYMVRMEVGQVFDPDANHAWAANHFWNAGLYIFDYPLYYPLIDLIRVVPQGPVIFDYHGVTPPELWASAEDRAHVEEGVRNVDLVGYADYAIAHSEFTRGELVATGLIPAERTSVVPYAVAFEESRAADLAPPPEAAGRSPVLLYVGRMAGNKRIDTLIRMAALVRPRYPRMRLLLVGDDTTLPYQPIVAAARALIAELDLTDHVIFTGPKNHAELPRYYETCDLYVTSSLHEGFCIPVVEAMAHGKPVVATNTTALPWTVGDAGLIFEPEDVEGMAAQVLAVLDSKYAGTRDEG
jgi:glycosyltransferase involved in cell wall biosynthesis